MVKYILIISFLLFSQKTLAQCFYNQISTSYSFDFVWFNIIDKVSQDLESSKNRSELSTEEIKKTFIQSSQSVKEVCGHEDSSYYNIQGLKNINWINELLSFNLNGRKYELERIEREGEVLWIYRRHIYEKFHNFMKIHLSEGGITSVQIIGRIAGEDHLDRYSFFFDSKREFEEKIKVRYLGSFSGEIKSLTSIYGKSYSNQMIKNPAIKVGVIGSGVDYNNPLLAKHIAFRDDFEEDLLKKENLLNNLVSKTYFSKEEYLDDLKTWRDLDENTGFPRWMDQALGSTKPSDRIIPMMPGASSEHETRMSSRIISGGGAIQLYSVRKMYGYSISEDYVEVVNEFSKNGVSLVNMSFAYACGGEDPYREQWEKVFSENPDMVFVVAAGNDGKNLKDELYCPAKYSQKYKNVVSVTALDEEGMLAKYNGLSVNYGSVDVAIKADNLEVFSPGSSWKNNKNGASSMAAAEVTRIISESVLAGKELDPESLKERLRQASVQSSKLNGVVLSGGELKEELF